MLTQKATHLKKKMKLNSKQELIPHGLNLKQVKKYSWQENLVYEYNPEAREIHHNKRSFDTTKLQLFERQKIHITLNILYLNISNAVRKLTWEKYLYFRISPGIYYDNKKLILSDKSGT